MKAVSLYIHVPFCKRRCSYCTFYHVPHIDELEHAFVDAAVEELGRAADEIDTPFFAPTVFFGGGTPSALSRHSLEKLFRAIEPYVGGDEKPEVTLEMNPEDARADLLTDLESWGVNRVSLGIQSMSPRLLRVLKRCGPEANRRAMELVSDRLNSFSVDLVLGIPGGSARDIEDTMTQVFACEPPHISTYCLEAGGDMAADVRSFLTGVDADGAADEYLAVCAELRKDGYRHYEVSNFAKPGHESRHNQVYWSGGEYLGIGPGAHSCVNGNRFSNEPSLELYLHPRGGSLVKRRDTRDIAQRELETLMLALRTSQGLPMARLSCPPAVPAELVAQGLASRVGDRLVLSDRGYLLLNDVLFRLIQVA